MSDGVGRQTGPVFRGFVPAPGGYARFFAAPVVLAKPRCTFARQALELRIEIDDGLRAFRPACVGQIVRFHIFGQLREPTAHGRHPFDGLAGGGNDGLFFCGSIGFRFGADGGGHRRDVHLRLGRANRIDAAAAFGFDGLVVSKGLRVLDNGLGDACIGQGVGVKPSIRLAIVINGQRLRRNGWNKCREISGHLKPHNAVRLER
ncbi:hypothetical protein Avi_3398 [Allorhizobium ampelinum S4]|uniref:Uncharacterized protein n=1 Tax=Allorhizobium ampelinum (strain ATCC BAA-846 / DSM 112012 / S4) TaxID=311402 RepID=B9JZX4_ALLAM|nr:hypothetical protein Avi_3398 [Allorhizobium ampelinum S4]